MLNFNMISESIDRIICHLTIGTKLNMIGIRECITKKTQVSHLIDMTLFFEG